MANKKSKTYVITEAVSAFMVYRVKTDCVEKAIRSVIIGGVSGKLDIRDTPVDEDRWLAIDSFKLDEKDMVKVLKMPETKFEEYIPGIVNVSVEKKPRKRRVKA